MGVREDIYKINEYLSQKIYSVKKQSHRNYLITPFQVFLFLTQPF